MNSRMKPRNRKTETKSFSMPLHVPYFLQIITFYKSFFYFNFPAMSHGTFLTFLITKDGKVGDDGTDSLQR